MSKVNAAQQDTQNKQTVSKPVQTEMMGLETAVTSPIPTPQRAYTDPRTLSPANAKVLQRTIGNKALGRLIIQRKMTVSPVGDKYEQEADAVAKQVVSKLHTSTNTSTSTTQRQEEEEMQMKPLIQRQEEEEEIQTKSVAQRQENEMQVNHNPMLNGGELGNDIESSVQSAKSGGQPISNLLRSPMEQAFGADFSGVKIHTDSRSDYLNRAIQARAFTSGEDIFFRQGEYNPGSSSGQELLAHELTHTIQQTGGQSPSVQTSSLNNPDTPLQRKLISVGDVSAKTTLRERPDGNSAKRGGSIEVKKNVIKTDNPPEKTPDSSGYEWIEAEVIAGDQIGFAGYLHYEKYRPARGQNGTQIEEEKLGYVTSSTKLRPEPTNEKAGPTLVPGDLFILLEEATQEKPFAKVRVITGNGRNQNGWLREGKMLMRTNPLVPDDFIVEDLTEAEARTGPDEIGDAPIEANEETTKDALLAALTDLDQKYQYIEYEIEKGGKPAQAVANALDQIETFFTSEATAPQRLKKEIATAAGQQEAQSQADDIAFEIMNDAVSLKKKVVNAQRILNLDVSQSSLDRVETQVNLMTGKQMYTSATEIYTAVKAKYDRLVSTDTETNPIIKESLAAAKAATTKKESGIEWGGELLGYTSESIADASSEGGEASISGLYGARTTQGATSSGDARITGAADQYDNEGEKIDKQSRQGYNALDKGALGLGSKDYAEFASAQSSVVQNAAKWMKGLGFLQDLSVTKEGISATATKLSIIKPFPPLASALLAIPLYPGVGVKLEAKVKASVSLSAGVSINWGDWLTSGSASKEQLDTLYSKQKTAKGKETLLKIKLRDGDDPQKQQAQSEFPTVAKEINTLDQSIAQQQKQLSKWSKDMTLKVKGQGKIGAMIGGEFFGGIFLGIPVANVSGGLYGEISATAGANIGIDGTFERKDEKWFKSANLSFDVNGSLAAEVGVKAGYQILFFSGDIAKFKIGDWPIAAFYVRGNKQLGGSKANPLTSQDGIDKKVIWGAGTPPIQTRVEESKDKAEESVGAVKEEIGGKLSAEQDSSYQEIHTAIEPGGAAAELGGQLEELQAKRKRLAVMESAAAKLPPTVEISGAKQQQMEQLRTDIAQLEETLTAVRDSQNVDMTELNGLLTALSEKHGSTFSKGQTLPERAQKDVGSFRTLSDTYFNQAKKRSFSVSRQMVLYKKKHDEAKAALDAYLALNRAGVDEYRTLEQQVLKQEKVVGAQKQTIKDLELQKSKIKNRKEGGKLHRASSEFSKQKAKELAQIDERIKPAKDELASLTKVLSILKSNKTQVRKQNAESVGAYKTLRDALAKAKTQYESIIAKLEEINSQMLKARSFAEEANILDEELARYAKQIEEVKKYKQLVADLKLALPAEEGD